MSTRSDYPHGVPCWTTCLAPDVPSAMDFYGGVLGWSYDTSDDGSYAVARLRDGEVAGIGSLAAAGPEATAAWITEVRVDDAAAIGGRVEAAGGKVLSGPLDLSPAGILVVIEDPTGAVFCAWEARGREGAHRINEAGAWSMSALQTADNATAAAFYGAVFGWETEMFGPATMFRLPGYVGGEPGQPVPRDVVAVMLPEAEGAAAWHVDFWVSDADAAVAAVEAGGGSVLAPVSDEPPFRQATVADPFGAAFSVSQLVA